MQPKGLEQNTSDPGVGTCKDKNMHQWVGLGYECDYERGRRDILKRRMLDLQVGDNLTVFVMPDENEYTHEDGDWTLSRTEVATVKDITYEKLSFITTTYFNLENPRHQTKRFQEWMLRLFEVVPNSTEEQEILEVHERNYGKGCLFSDELSSGGGVGLLSTGLSFESAADGNFKGCVDWGEVNGVCARAIMNELVKLYRAHRSWHYLGIPKTLGGSLFADQYLTAKCENSFAKRDRSAVLARAWEAKVCWDFVVDFHSLYCDTKVAGTSAPYRDVCTISADDWKDMSKDDQLDKMTDLAVRGGEEFTREDAIRYIKINETGRCKLPATSDGLVLADTQAQKRAHTIERWQARALWLYAMDSKAWLEYTKPETRNAGMKFDICDVTPQSTPQGLLSVKLTNGGYKHDLYTFKLGQGVSDTWVRMMECLRASRCKT